MVDVRGVGFPRGRKRKTKKGEIQGLERERQESLKVCFFRVYVCKKFRGGMKNHGLWNPMASCKVCALMYT